MNREIKFRVWSTKEKKWMFGYEHENLGGFTLFGEVVLMGEIASYSLERYFTDFVVMQYTGMTDKNGKKIYEGDILQGVSANIFSDGNIKNYEVMWGVDSWHIKGTLFGIQELFNYCNNNVTVIGNIFENPELI